MITVRISKHELATIPTERVAHGAGKLATPRDQGNAALFLASDLASHITGEYLIVSGGEFMNA